jgi:tRNA (guanine37-N1)-methyltransferase
MQLVVGRIAKAHGIAGEVAVEVRTDEPELRFAPGVSLDTDPADRGPLTVRRSRWHSGRLLVSFDDVGDRTAAEALRSTLLVVDSSTSPPLDDHDEFWDHQLVGLEVTTVGGSPLGVVDDVLHPPGSDLLAIRRPDGGELLVPFVSTIVPRVDLAAGRVLDIVTIFPDYFAPLDVSLLGKARRAGLVDIRLHDLRSWTDDVHRTVDDTPYGGGPGMIMAPEPWGRALDEVTAGDPPPRLVIPTPSGRRFTQADARAWAGERRLVFAPARYEGLDARVAEDARRRLPVDEVSIGDYVLAGGEVAVLVMVEAVTRLLPGFMGNADSVADESFESGLLEAPAYTRPASWRGLDVPPVLLSGDHGAIARWREEQARSRTAERRPDLLG